MANLPSTCLTWLDLFAYNSESKSLQLVETRKLNVSWYVYTHESRMVLLASGMQCKTFNGFQASLPIYSSKVAVMYCLCTKLMRRLLYCMQKGYCVNLTRRQRLATSLCTKQNQAETNSLESPTSSFSPTCQKRSGRPSWVLTFELLIVFLSFWYINGHPQGLCRHHKKKKNATDDDTLICTPFAAANIMKKLICHCRTSSKQQAVNKGRDFVMLKVCTSNLEVCEHLHEWHFTKVELKKPPKQQRNKTTTKLTQVPYTDLAKDQRYCRRETRRAAAGDSQIW